MAFKRRMTTKYENEIRFANRKNWPKTIQTIGFIYKITRLSNGQVYVGQTCYTPQLRWNGHLKRAHRNMDTRPLTLAILEDGPYGFLVEVLEQVFDLSKLDSLEQKYITELKCLYPNGLNMTSGGQINNFKRHEEANFKLAKTKTKKTFVDNPKPLAKARKTDSKRGVAQRKKVQGTHVETGEVIHLDSLSADSRFDPRLISACCYGKRRFHRQYSWEFVQ